MGCSALIKAAVIFFVGISLPHLMIALVADATQNGVAFAVDRLPLQLGRAAVFGGIGAVVITGIAAVFSLLLKLDRRGRDDAR
jgi:hypothetical protein